MTYPEIKGKKILILHTNFPGQFKYICNELAGSNAILFMCKTHYGRRIKKVSILTIKNKFKSESQKNTNQTLFEISQETAEHYRQAMMRLKDQGWEPDLILSHSGWGCGLHAREVWPKSTVIAYVEWWFNPESELFFYDENNQFLNLNRRKIPNAWKRNQIMALELAAANELVSPTYWQKSQLPKNFENKCKVIYDGIDTKFFKPSRESFHKNFVVTYGTRGMEPMRGFPQFVKAITIFARKRDNIVIRIAGNDEINYGGAPSPDKNFKSWGLWAKYYFEKNNVAEKIEWTGRLQKENYRNFLQESDCHIYLTHPFVASWSLLDALACGTTIVASDLKCVSEITEYALQKDQIHLIDHRNISSIVQAIDNLYEEKMFNKSLPTTNKSSGPNKDKKIDDLSLESSMRHWTRLMSRAMAREC